MKITNRIVEAYLNCKYKACLLLKGETGTPHDYEVLMNELQAEYQPKETEALLRRCKLESAPTISSVTVDDLEQGHPLILDCTVEDDKFQFHFDALEKTEGKSSLGRFHYRPVLFHHADSLREIHRTLLALPAVVRRFVPPEIKNTHHFGDGLVSWAMYQYVANRMTFDQIKLTAQECFGIKLPLSRCHHFKQRLAAQYKSTVDNLFAGIRCGPLLHADETKIRLKSGSTSCKGTFAFQNLRKSTANGLQDTRISYSSF